MIEESNIHYVMFHYVMLIVLIIIDNIIHTGCHMIQYRGITQKWDTEGHNQHYLHQPYHGPSFPSTGILAIIYNYPPKGR